MTLKHYNQRFANVVKALHKEGLNHKQIQDVMETTIKDVQAKYAAELFECGYQQLEIADKMGYSPSHINNLVHYHIQKVVAKSK